MQHTAGLKFFGIGVSTSGVAFDVILVIQVLVLFFGIEVVEVAEKLVETMHCRQMRIVVPKVILAELAGTITCLFHHFGEAGRGRLQAQFVTRLAHGG